MIGDINKGYRRVLLSKSGIKKHFLVHRLIAETFIPKVDGREYVNHRDGNKLNNCASNLEWCTRSENQIHAYEKGLQKVNVKEAHKVRHKQTRVGVCQIDMNGNFIKSFNSISEAASELGIKNGSHISAVARGKRNSCGGYRWKYHS